MNDYIESIGNIADRLRTLPPMEPLYTEEGEVCYTVSGGRVTFLLRDGARLVRIACFTSEAACRREKELIDAGVRDGEMKDMELFVFSDRCSAGDYFTIVVRDCEDFVPVLPRKNDASEDDSFREMVEGRRPFEKDGLWGFSDCDGRIVIEPKYDIVGEFSEARAVVGLGGMAGLIDRSGNEILPLEYDELSWDGNALVYADLIGKKGCFDRMGAPVVPCLYDWIGEFSNGLALVVKNGKHGFVDFNGKEVLPLVYDSATSFDDGHAIVGMGSRQMVIDTSGREIE